jgi:membrane protease YdiL (CAAX protease family)
MLLAFVFLAIGQFVAAIPLIVQRVIAVAANPAMAHAPVKIDAAPFMFWANAVTIALVLLWMWAFERRSPAAIGLGRGIWTFAGGYLTGIVMFCAVTGLMYAFGGLNVAGPGAWQAPSAATLMPLLLFVGVFIVQGSGEEILTRGWVLQVVSSRHGLAWGIAINALFFGFLHVFNEKPAPDLYMGVFNIVLYAIFVSLYAIKARSLWGACGIHAAWNYVQGPGFGLDVSGIKLGVAPLFVALADKPGAAQWLTGGNFGPEASVATTVVMAAGIVWMLARGAMKPGDSYPVEAKPAAENIA